MRCRRARPGRTGIRTRGGNWPGRRGPERVDGYQSSASPGRRWRRLTCAAGCSTSPKLGDPGRRRQTARPASDTTGTTSPNRPSRGRAASRWRRWRHRACWATTPTTICNSARNISAANNFGSRREELPQRRGEAPARRRGLGRACGFLRPAAPLRSRRPRLWRGHSPGRAHGRRSSTTRASPTCCAAITRGRAQKLEQARARIRAIPTSRPTCNCSKTAPIRARLPISPALPCRVAA